MDVSRAISTALPKIERLEFIGAGNFAHVYRCRKRFDHHGPEFAVKVIDLDTSRDPCEVAQEVIVMRMSFHDNITKLFSATLRGKKLSMMMELASAGSVSELIKIKGSVSEPIAAIILRGTLQGLAYLHQYGWVHLDIKSNNILMTQDGIIKLCDFGVAVVAQGSMESAIFDDADNCSNVEPPPYLDWFPPACQEMWITRETKKKEDVRFAGTPLYMAPEIIRRQSLSPACDIWSAGIVAIELVAGNPPYADIHPLKAMQLVVKSPPPQVPVKHSAQYKQLIEAMLQKDPTQRTDASTLLNMKLLKSAKSNKKLKDLLQPYNLERRKLKKDEMVEMYDDDDDDDESGLARFHAM
eukprot:gene2917-5730_t